MASSHHTGILGNTSAAVARVPSEQSAPARVMAELPRRGSPDDRSPSPASRHDGGERSAEREGTNAGVPRGTRREDSRDSMPPDDDGDHDESKMEGKSNVSTLWGEYPLISVPLDTWVGRYVRITTPRHNGTTGLVHRTGNGWVNLLTANGEVAKRAYDLVVIPEERANIRRNDTGVDKGESRGKRHRSPKDSAALASTPTFGLMALPRGVQSRNTPGLDPSSIESTSGSGDERKSASRGRSTRTSAATAPTHSSSDSSGQEDDQDEEGDEDEHENGRPRRRRARAVLDGSDFDDADEDDDDKDDRYDRFDEDGRLRTNARGKPFPSMKPGRAMARGGGRERGERYIGGDYAKDVSRSAGRITPKYGGREINNDKCRGRSKGDQDKVKERERGRAGGDQTRGVAGREREASKGERFMDIGRGKEREVDGAASRVKRKEPANSFISIAEGDDKLAPSNIIRDRVDRSKDKPAMTGGGKKEETVKQSWLNQISKGKERPNLVRWREELVAITKDSSEDYEDASLSVELMRMRCEICYHEKADGDKFCWNEQCWLSPIFTGYFNTGPYASSGNGIANVENASAQRIGYVNTFGRETVIDSALTSALQAPVKWIESTRKKRRDAFEVFSEDPALYRWQCWASNFKDPNSKDPTYIDEKVS